MIKRDFIGIEPLYYHWDGTKLLSGQDINALFAQGIPKEVDELSLYRYLKYQYLLGESTLFKGIKKLLPGHKLSVKKGVLFIEPYWDIEEKALGGIDYVGELRGTIWDSVKGAISGVSPVGVFLSGGLDSSIVAALASKNCKELHSFSALFDAPLQGNVLGGVESEAHYAQIVSKQLETKHHEIRITPDDARQVLFKVAKGYADPIGDAAIVNLYLLAEEASNYVPLVLAGDGADEVFAGYPWHSLGMRYARIFNMPGWAKFPLKAALSCLGTGDFNSWLNRLAWLASVFCQPSLQDAHLYMTATMTDSEIKWLTYLEPSSDGILPVDGICSPLNRMLALDCKNLLPEKFLVKTWCVARANGIDVKIPLLDRKVVEMAFQIPPEYKLRRGIGKYVLRQTFEGMLPNEIVWRKKQGFGTPLAHWLNDKVFGSFVCERLRNGEMIHRYFRGRAIREIIRAIESGKVWNYHQANAIWTVFALQLWYDVYFK